MAQGFIKKNWQKDATNVLIEAAIRSAGGIGTAFVTNKVFVPKKNEKGEESKMLYNIGGPVMTAVGILGDMMVADPKFKAFFQGMSTYGVMHSIAVIADKKKDGTGDSLAWLSINGPEEDAALMSGIGALGTTTATDENSTAANPPELTAFAAGQRQITDGDGKTYNNDWAYLAENIDNADQITRTVNGVAENAAALMGVDTPQEAALLMGMF